MIGRGDCRREATLTRLGPDGTLSRRTVQEKESGCILLTPFGKAVLKAITDNYLQLADIAFTAEMETMLDRIADDTMQYRDVMDAFWTSFGNVHDTTLRSASPKNITKVSRSAIRTRAPGGSGRASTKGL